MQILLQKVSGWVCGSAFPSDLEVTLPVPGPHVEQQRFMIPDMPFLSHIPLFPLPFLL